MKTSLIYLSIATWLLMILGARAQATSPEFWSSQNSGVAPLTIEFFDNIGSVGIKEWDFDGDGITDATGDKPNFIYKKPGVYTVTLKVSGIATPVDIRKIGLIRAIDGTVPDFWADITNGQAPLSMYFHSTLPDTTKMSWDFDGDGKEDSGLAHPQFTYSIPGDYTVIYSYFDGKTMQNIKKDMYIKVRANVAINASFWTADNVGIAPYISHFESNIPSETTSYTWDFNNDGIIDSKNQNNPSFEYKIPGVYTVVLILEKNGIIDSIIKPNYITVEDGAGRFCDKPILAKNGINEFKSNKGGSMFFSYTATMDGFIVVSSCGMTDLGTWAQVMYSCNSYGVEYNESECQNQTKLAIESRKGETYIIEWNTYSPDGSTPPQDAYFEWSLNERPIQPGELCNKPAIAIEGTNIANIWGVTEGVWFTYLAKRDGIVTVSNCDQTYDDTELIIFKDSCFGALKAYNDDECLTQSTVQFQSKIGQTYYIWWQTKDRNKQTSFKWSLLIEEGVLPPGSSCDNPVFLKEGGNTLEFKNSLNWFEYTAQNEGRIIFDVTDLEKFVVNEEIGALRNCQVGDNENEYLQFDGTNFFIWALKGQKYNIYWFNTPGNSRVEYLTIKEDPQLIPSGIFCENPIKAQEGINSAELKANTQWFTYTVREDGFLSVSNCEMTNGNSRLMIYKSCNTYPIAEDYGSCNGQSSLDIEVKAGNTYYIAWSGESALKFEWKLKFSSSKDINIYGISFAEQSEPPVIDYTNRYISATVGANASLTMLHPNINIPYGAEAYINGDYYDPNNMMGYDLSNKSILNIIAADGVSKSEWTIVVKQNTIYSSAANILKMALLGINLDGIITGNTVNFNIPYTNNPCYPIAISISALAHAETSNGDQIYNNYYFCLNGTNPDSIRVIAEDGTQKWWYINSKMAPKPLGIDCNKPLDGILGMNSGEFIDGNIWYRLKIERDGYYGIKTLDSELDVNIYFDECYSTNYYMDHIDSQNSAVIPAIAGQTLLIQLNNNNLDIINKYTVELFKTEPRTGADITYFDTYDFPILNKKIDSENGIIYLLVPSSASIEQVNCRIQISEGAYAEINGIEIFNDLILDMTMEQKISVFAEDGTEKTWLIQVEKQIENVAAEIEAFSMLEQTIQPIINSTEGIIYAQVNKETDLTNLTAYIQISLGAKILYGNGVVYISGETFLDFTEPVYFTVLAENGSEKLWTISVTNQTSTDVQVEGIFFPQARYKLEVGQSISINAFVEPPYATNQSITYKSADTKIAGINTTGIVEGFNVGLTTITATDASGIFSTTAEIEVISPALKQIEIVPNTLSLIKGDELKLQVKFIPEITNDKAIKWSVNNPSIANISEDGIITALASGKTEIIAHSVSSADIFSVAILEVIEDEIPLTSIRTIKDRVFLSGGGLYQITPVFIPLDATYKGLTFTSENPEIAQVDEFGVIYAGNLLDTTVIRIKSIKYPEIETKLEVIIDKQADVLVESIVIPTTLNISINTTVIIKPEIMPLNATSKALSWVSLDQTIVKIGADGGLIGIKEGEASIFSISKDGGTVASNECLVIVRPTPVKEITVNVLSELILEVGTIDDGVKALVQPIEASNKSIFWRSSNPTIAKVDSLTGFIYGLNIGEVLITITSVSNPAISASFKVIVKSKQLDKTILKNAITETANFIEYLNTNGLIGINPNQYPDSIITNLATLLQESITIYENATSQFAMESATSVLQNALKKARNSMIGKILLTDIVLNINKMSISIDRTGIQLKTEIQPSNATNRELDWMSENTGIISVSTTGELKPNSSGTTTIYVHATDGSAIYDSCIVTVIAPVSAIVLPNAIGLELGESKSLQYAVLPEFATNKTILWKSENPEIISITQEGIITALGLGSCKIIATSASGTVTAMTIISVVEKSEPVQSVILPELLELTVGTIVPMKPNVKPFNATNKMVYWSSSSPLVITIDNFGIVKALAPGQAKIYVITEDGRFTDSTNIKVYPSLKPKIGVIPTLTIKQGVDSIAINLADFISDDNTNFDNLKLNIPVSNYFDVRREGGLLIIKQTSESPVGENQVNLSVTDRDGLTTEFNINIVISIIENKAPRISTIPARTIKRGADFNPIKLPAFVTDDYTPSNAIIWSIVQGNNLYIRISELFAQIIILNSEFIGTETIKFIATDSDGLSDTTEVQFTISEAVNVSPTITQIPDQTQTEEVHFSNFDLMSYVTDDYTLPENISWEASTSAKIAIVIKESIVNVSVIDNSWMGSEIIKFTATDEGGLTAETKVTFTQKATIDNTDWSGKPQVDFYADRTVVAVGSPANFHASISGIADLGWEWEFEGGTPAMSNELEEKVIYTIPGYYDVAFRAMNYDGTDSLIIKDYLSVFGILKAPDTVCSGNQFEIAVSDQSLNSYAWSTGDSTPNISIKPTQTTTYIVTATFGLFKLIDSVTIIVPQVLDLGEDQSLCANEQLDIDLSQYEAINWNMGGMQTDTKQFTVTELGKYYASVTDKRGCITTDSISITEIYRIPTVGLVKNIKICAGTSAILGASNDLDLIYLWSTTQTEPSIEVFESGKYLVTVTDENNCSTVDSALVEVLDPYAEQIGIVTSSESSNNTIIGWERTKSKRTKEYKVLRETGTHDLYDTIATILYTEASFYIDTQTNTDQQAYKYKLITVDSCGNMAESTPHITMHLQMSQSIESGINLTWTQYSPEELFKSYIIYRSTPNGNLDSVASVASGTGTSWTEVENISHAARYRVAVRFDHKIDPTRFKSDSGPYSQSISNLSEAVVISKIKEKSHREIILFPQPTDDLLNIIIIGTIGDNHIVHIFNSTGLAVLEGYLDQNKNGYSGSLDISALQGGVYTIQISTDKEIITKSIVIE